jgi:hypothetical protein
VIVKRKLQSVSTSKNRVSTFFLFLALPAWLGPGVLDWWFHRRTKIEEPDNGGVAESIIHSVLFAEGGVSLIVSAFFEMNPLAVTIMTLAAIAHEATAVADVKLAMSSSREVSQGEQHVHSFLEVMPFAVIPLLVLLHEPMSSDWALRRREPLLSKRDLGVVTALIGIFGVMPFGEELVRCVRTRRRRVV